jgi:hypothetical protein
MKEKRRMINGGRWTRFLSVHSRTIGSCGPIFYDPDTKICLLDFIPRLRNELAHGSTKLFPGGSHIMLKLCAEILNKLF